MKRKKKLDNQNTIKLRKGKKKSAQVKEKFLIDRQAARGG